MQPEAIIYVSLAFILGGVLKGGTGVGVPFIAVPVQVHLFLSGRLRRHSV
jgi:uncharacterized membrane protein YfcA